MLSTLDGKPVNSVPRADDFADVLRRLGPERAQAIRQELDGIVAHLRPGDNGKRSFSSSHLGSQLSPWGEPLSFVTDVSRQIEGPHATEEQIRERSSWIFGLFVWECIMNRPDDWRFYDPNLSSRDPNKEITGKVYFEQ